VKRQKLDILNVVLGKMRHKRIKSPGERKWIFLDYETKNGI